MTPRAKEWIINGCLLAGIFGLLTLIALAKMGGTVALEETVEGVPHAIEPTPILTVAQTVYDDFRGPADQFANLGRTNIFREVITPSPTPARPTPTPLPTPSLERVTADWQFQYSVPRKGLHVFLDTKAKKEITILEDEWTPFTDARVKASINIRARPKSKIEVTLEGQPAGRDEIQTRDMGY